MIDELIEVQQMGSSIKIKNLEFSKKYKRKKDFSFFCRK